MLTAAQCRRPFSIYGVRYQAHEPEPETEPDTESLTFSPAFTSPGLSWRFELSQIASLGEE